MTTLNGLRRLAAEAPAIRRVLLRPSVRSAVSLVLSLRFVVALRCVSRPDLFLLRSVGSRGLAAYRLRGSDVRIVLSHGEGALELVYEIFRERCYRLPASLCNNSGAKILDLGANVGAFAAYAHSEAPGAQIVCVEPDDANLGALALFCRLNPSANVRLIAACAGTEDDSVRFVSGLGSASHTGDGGELVTQVDALPLLTWADFAKIDIERSEWPILSDPRLSEVGPLFLAMEYHRRWPFDKGALAEATRLLELAGFHVVRTSPNYWGHGLVWAKRDGP